MFNLIARKFNSSHSYPRVSDITRMLAKLNTHYGIHFILILKYFCREREIDMTQFDAEIKKNNTNLKTENVTKGKMKLTFWYCLKPRFVPNNSLLYGFKPKSLNVITLLRNSYDRVANVFWMLISKFLIIFHLYDLIYL